MRKITGFDFALLCILTIMTVIVFSLICTVCKAEEPKIQNNQTNVFFMLEQEQEDDLPEYHKVAEEPFKPIIAECPLSADVQQMIYDKCQQYNIDFAFCMAVIKEESTFRPSVISYNGTSVGLMQINKCNHKRLSQTLGITDFFDPEQNVTAGVFMLRELFDKYDDPHSVLMAYNCGEGGAKNLWKKGIYTSKYSRNICATAERYAEELTKE